MILGQKRVFMAFRKVEYGYGDDEKENRERREEAGRRHERCDVNSDTEDRTNWARDNESKEG